MKPPVMFSQISSIGVAGDHRFFFLAELVDHLAFDVMGMGGCQPCRHPFEHAAIGVERFDVMPVEFTD